MAAIFKYDVNYSTGGSSVIEGSSNIVEINYADYLLLSEEEKMSDVTYLIPDYPGTEMVTKEDLGIITESIENKADKATTLEGYGITDAETKGTAETVFSTHNVSETAHNDIRELITDLGTRLNALADSDDTTLDQLSEIVAYIKSNKTLIDAVTTSKVSISDIVNDLTTNKTDKPLSATQGMVIKALIDTLETAIQEHIGDDTHVTSEEKTTWNTKANSNEIIVDNLIPYPYVQTARTASDVTFTINEDGTIHAKGKPSAQVSQGIRTRTTGDKNPMILPPGTYTVHGCPEGGSLTSYYFQVGRTVDGAFSSLGNDYGNGTTFTIEEESQIQILLIIAANCPEIDLVFKPMCEIGEVIHEYQPYVLSRHYLLDNTCVENLIPYPYYHTSSNIGGIDWVDNGDGTVTASGTENHETNTISTFSLASVYNPFFLEAGTYTFTGCPEGASAETWFVRFGDENNNFLASDFGEGCYFTLETDQYVTVSLRVADNVAIPDKIVFKPMLVKGSVPREYKPYKNVEDQIIADNLLESNIYSTGFVRCETKAYNNGTCILTADGTTGNPYHCRDYVLEQGKVYTFSVKGNSADAKGWYMSAIYVFDTSPITFENIKSAQIYTNNYKTQSITFAVNKECRAVRITIGIPNSAATAGTKATFTEMMLEEGPVAHKYQPVKANKGYNRVDITNHTLNLDTLNLELGSPDIMQYKCRTSGGSANITNIPVTNSPFNLDVEVVRWASKTDYVTRQVFVAVNKPNFEYVRWCTNGTWSNWEERKYTDTTYSNASTTTAGLMSSTDKTKLDGINTGYGICSTVADIAEKIVPCDGWVLTTGSEITVKFTITNTVSNPTLNVNNTGAKHIYYRGSAITAGYLAANRTYTFKYNGTQYELVGDLDSNSFDRIRYNGDIKCGTTDIVSGNIIVGKNGTFQHLKLGQAFDITYPILYAGAAIAANGTGSNNYKCIACTITTTQNMTLTAYKPIYIKGTLSGTTFTPISTSPLTQAIPNTADGYQYILLGLAYASNGFYLYPENPVYECSGLDGNYPTFRPYYPDRRVEQEHVSIPSYLPLLFYGNVNQWSNPPTVTQEFIGKTCYSNKVYVQPSSGTLYAAGGFYGTVEKDDIINDLDTAVAVTDTQTPVGCGVVKELHDQMKQMLQIVSFDASTGTLTTKSFDYTG